MYLGIQQTYFIQYFNHESALYRSKRVNLPQIVTYISYDLTFNLYEENLIGKIFIWIKTYMPHLYGSPYWIFIVHKVSSRFQCTLTPINLIDVFVARGKYWISLMVSDLIEIDHIIIIIIVVMVLIMIAVIFSITFQFSSCDKQVKRPVCLSSCNKESYIIVRTSKLKSVTIYYCVIYAY